MAALYIIGIIIFLLIIIGIGYYLWSVSLEKYDYNIFNLGNIIRGIIATICFFFALVAAAPKGADSVNDLDSAIVWAIVSVIMWLWTFIATMVRTNFFIALFSLFYQFFATLFVFNLLLKIFSNKD